MVVSVGFQRALKFKGDSERRREWARKRRKCTNDSICRLRTVVLSRFVQQKYWLTSNSSSTGRRHVGSIVTAEEQRKVGW